MRYIEFVADRLLTVLGHPKFCNVDTFLQEDKFFEKRVGDYQKSGVMSSVSEGGAEGVSAGFSLDEDF